MIEGKKYLKENYSFGSNINETWQKFEIFVLNIQLNFFKEFKFFLSYKIHTHFKQKKAKNIYK